MRRRIKKSLATLATAALLAGSSTAVRAEDAATWGVARISDSPAPIPSAELEPAPDAADCGYGGSCEANGYGSHLHGSHPPHSPLYFFLTNRGGASYAPDHGWRRPVKTPIRRVPLEYKRYWPAKWYGEPGSGLGPKHRVYPMVYTPTDTTQLGFYYQHVPQWRPNPAMLPPRPWPAHWHRRELVQPCGDCYGEYGYNGAAVYGESSVIDGEPVESPVPAGPTDDDLESAPPTPPVPDNEIDKSASSIWDLKTVGG